MIPFYRVIKRGSTGKDVRAVKRALARAGHGRLRDITPLFGPFAVRNLQAFQREHGILATGRYGRRSHAELSEHFDSRAAKLYAQAAVKKPPPPPPGALQLLSHFKYTHQTSGLDGYPAIDLFAAPGTPALAPEDAKVVRLSGKDPKKGGRPGGGYGWSIYLQGDSGKRYYATHFGTLGVKRGQRVRYREPLGTVCDSAVSGKPGTSHIHLGCSRP